MQTPEFRHITFLLTGYEEERVELRQRFQRVKKTPTSTEQNEGYTIGLDHGGNYRIIPTFDIAVYLFRTYHKTSNLPDLFGF